MTDDKNIPPEHESIAPAQVTLNVDPRGAHGASADSKAKGHPLLLWLGLGLACAALLGVVFVLPSHIEAPARPVAANNESVAEQTAPAPSSATPKESPWTDAQIARQRREAQDILSKLLDRQEKLETVAVERWAPEAFKAAQASAAEADVLYRRQEYQSAQQKYQEALQQFDDLLNSSEQTLHEEIARGEAAILEGDEALAKRSFELALAIDPNEADAQTGLRRAKVLDQVLAKVKAGKQLERDNDLDGAKAQYQAALKLDPQNQTAQQQLQAVNAGIKERDFAKQMSLGFAAVHQENYTKAISAFESALAIKPNAADAKDALTQAKNQSTQSTLQQTIARANTAESEGRWHDAVKAFEQALALDENLVEARVGLIRTKTRADIHDKLEAILAAPERLTAAGVHREYQQFYQEVRAIKNPDSTLIQQLDQLAEELERAVQPVTVQFISDNATQVVLYKVGELGSFSEKSLTLQPGQYTAVGTRPGYRDVRRDFRVSVDQQNPITIQCDEKISKG